MALRSERADRKGHAANYGLSKWSVIRGATIYGPRDQFVKAEPRITDQVRRPYMPCGDIRTTRSVRNSPHGIYEPFARGEHFCTRDSDEIAGDRGRSIEIAERSREDHVRAEGEICPALYEPLAWFVKAVWHMCLDGKYVFRINTRAPFVFVFHIKYEIRRIWF